MCGPEFDQLGGDARSGESGGRARAPAGLPSRDLIIFAAFSFILLTVLVQGTTLGWLVRATGLAGGGPRRAAAEAVVGVRMRVVQASLNLLNALRDEHGGPRRPQPIEEYSRRARALGRHLDAEAADHARRRDHSATALLAIGAGRRELIRLHREGPVVEETTQTIEAELDFEEARFARSSRL